MNDLNEVSSEYKANSATSLENDYVLKWYSKRIANLVGECEHLLELGIGHGFTSSILNDIAKQHTIIEGSSAVIEQFQQASPQLDANIVHDYFETFETEQSFDLIVMGFVLEHVDDPSLLLNKYTQLLTANGRLFIAVPNAKSLNRRFGLAMKKIPDIYELNDNDHALGHKRNYCLDSLKDEIISARLTIEKVEGIYLKPLPIHVLKTLPDFEQNMQAMLEVGVDFPELSVGLLVECSFDGK